MGKVVQEKFEVRPPQNRNDDSQSGWVTDRSVRVKKGTPGREGYVGGDWKSKTMDNCVFYPSLPPGSNITDQEMSDIRQEPMSGGNLGNGNQVTTDVTMKSLREGFDRKMLRPTDDMYTREHNDAFYDDVEVDGVVGYIERNNYLDRM